MTDLERITTTSVQTLLSLLQNDDNTITTAIFFQVCETLLNLSSTHHVYTNILHGNVLKGNLSTPAETHARHFLTQLASLEEQIDTLLRQKLHLGKSHTLPLICQLGTAFELTDHERRAFIFLQLSGTGVHGAMEFQKENVLEKLRCFAKMTTTEIFTFLSPKRKHMAENIIELTEDEFGGDFSAVQIRMPREVLLALSGCEVTTDDLLKLEGTTLLTLLNSTVASKKKATVSSTSVEHTSLAQDENLEKEVEVDEEALFVLLQEQELYTAEKDDELFESSESSKSSESSEQDALKQPYTTDLQYLDDVFQMISYLVKKYMLDLETDSNDSYNILTRKSPEAIGREYTAKANKFKRRWELRKKLTKQAPSTWVPRLELLTALLGLCSMEQLIVLTLVGAVISQDVKKAISGGSSGRRGNCEMDVGTVIGLFCNTLSEQIHARQYFYKSSHLVKMGIVQIRERQGGIDLTACGVSVDRRMLDWILGLETEISELVEGGLCFSPTVQLAQVVIRPSTKELLLDTLCDHDAFVKLQKQAGLASLMPTGRGLIIMFHGPPGTGKTMLANALANHLNKKILSIDLPNFTKNIDSNSFQYLFREAKLQNAVIFLDECEPLFESRDRRGGGSVNVALTALDKFAGIMILATNRAFDLDDAMHRRINLSIHFQFPDAHQREQIWLAHVPSSADNISIHKDINWTHIAQEYELNGGFIKNAMLQSLKFAASRSLRAHRKQAKDQGETKDATEKQKTIDAATTTTTTTSPICLQLNDVVRACKLQVRGHLDALSENTTIDSSEMTNRASKDVSLHSLVCSTTVRKQVQDIVAHEKMKRTLGHDWGFDESEYYSNVQMSGRRYLFRGPRGVGKSFITKAIGFECGRALRTWSWMDLLRTKISSSGGTGSNHGTQRRSTTTTIRGLFRDARNSGCIVVIEQCESLFNGRCNSSSTSSSMQTATESVLYHLNLFVGTVIFCVTTPPPPSSSSHYASMKLSETDTCQIWNPEEQPLGRMLSDMLTSTLVLHPPTNEERALLWKKLIPPQTPIDTAIGIDFNRLSSYKMVGKEIQSCVFKACSRASRRLANDRVLTMADLVQVVEELMTAKENFDNRTKIHDLYL
jgi:SpoVK/Ycf46/Vps4 family AAA+-type ATPase